MRNRRLLLLVPFVLILVVVLFFWLRPETEAFGPAVALCPGPDLYGYTCDDAGGYAYIDATNDTRLYADDATITLALPFPFTFYGTVYEEVVVSTNGNLQFTTANAQFENACLAPAPADFMGDLIAPYWDDLDIRFVGFLETELSGEMPNRVFVIEWDDVPHFGDEEETVTFSVQLHEGSNDIVFLYEDVTTLSIANGRSATIGIQSEAQDVALQFSCNQPTITDVSGLLVAHPAAANADLGLQTVLAPVPVTNDVQAKGDIADFLAALNARGQPALAQWQQHWRNQTPPLQTTFARADVTGNGRDALILLRQGQPDQPHLSQLFLFHADDNGRFTLSAALPLSTRSQPFAAISLVDSVDLTGDGAADLLLRDDRSHQLVVLSTHSSDTLRRMPIPRRCSGSLALVDTTGDGVVDIVRSGCGENPDRQTTAWDGAGFSQQR